MAATATLRGAGLGRRQAEMAEMNVTPLVDVMLVLLIIFMIAVPMVTQRLRLDLPQAGPTVLIPETVELAIKDTGELYWNGTAISKATLITQLVVAAQMSEQPLIQIHPDRNTAYQQIASVLAAAKNAGVIKIGIEPATTYR